ncbi:hypothetical protein BCR32DRAFT_272403 [Anaeromyces robustus]|uniref:G-protein coupled receptors family 3 profile domain-containing protein n=1 Tax=Anaeromyces robustus TaxID=1754192 RepID=A0A1Y1W8X0_9FUNG|nr:hypothetical protein BCR32DRAFT_272403 [Anaeromyces robustus]|eukprot:ORX69845.1 hypothetical protein BCR32DRAFT_272403 [Anaeromyces robustus]
MKFLIFVFLFSILFSNVFTISVKLCLWDIYANYTDLILNTYNNLYGANSNIQLNVESVAVNENMVVSITMYNCDIAMVDPIYIYETEKNIHSITEHIQEAIQSRTANQELYKDLIEDITIKDTVNNEDKIFGLPFFLDFGVLFYNTQLANSAPETWDDLNKISESNHYDMTITQYAGQFTDYKEYYYNFVEAVANFSEDENYTLFGDASKEAIENFLKLFEKDIINEKAWNQSAALMKTNFCSGKVIFMRNWLTYKNDLSLCEGLNFSVAPIPKSKSKNSPTGTLLRGIYLTMTKITSKENVPQVAKAIVDLTSKEFLDALISYPIFSDVTPYLESITDNIGSEYCNRIDCNFYSSIINNLITKPIGRFAKDNYGAIMKDSYEYIKGYYKSKKEITGKTMDDISDYFDDKYIKWTDISAIIISAITGLGILVTLVVFVIVIKNRTALVIRRSSPLFLYIMLVGILISFGSIYTYIGKPTSLICNIRPLILVLAFGLAFLALFIKTFRIKVIFDKSDIKVQDKYLLIYSGSILLVELIIVGLWTFLSKMEPDIIKINSKMHYYACKNTSKLGFYFQLALIVINAIILLYGCYLAVKVKDVYSDYNESKVIGLSIYGIMICMIIQLIISACDNLGISVIFIIQSLMIILSSVILLTFMFIPKFWKLHMTGSSLNPSSHGKSGSQKYPTNNNQNNSYSTKSDKNGYINMQNYDNDYLYNNENMGQRNNYYNSKMNGSSESLDNYYNIPFNNNLQYGSGNSYNYKNNLDSYNNFNY